MSTALLTETRQRHTSIHPPDAGGHQTLTIPDRTARLALPLTERVLVHLALRVLQRSIRSSDDASSAELRHAQDHARSEREAVAVLAFTLQRRLL